MEIKAIQYTLSATDILVFFVDEELNFSEALNQFDLDKHLKNSLSLFPHFKGKKGQFLTLTSPYKDVKLVILAGLGKEAELDELALELIAGKLCNHLNSIEAKTARVVFTGFSNKNLDDAAFAFHMGLAMKLRNYRFNHYFTKKLDEKKTHLQTVEFAVKNHQAAEESLAEIANITEGVFLTRDLVSTPPNDLYPATFAAECKKLEKAGVAVTVIREKEMEKLGMGALLAVGQGSEKESHLVVMEYFGAKSKKEQPIAFVGKGVCFDSGGISIKPSANMGDMKYDMGGAGVVTGLMKTLALRKAKVNVVAVIGLVENMPSGSAYRPGDVLKSMSGQTIEIDNTDAEGRLVLADALWYTQKEYDPKFMINLATLTGAIVVALGENYTAGLFSNDDTLAEQLTASGIRTNERVWRLPLAEFYDKQINSDIADVKNTGSGRGAGSITAGQFLQRFVNKKTWAHIDIAGMTWDKQGNDLNPKGATGYGVRLLNELVKNYYEAK